MTWTPDNRYSARRSSVEKQRPLVVLIHGTWAARNESIGDAWWQSGSQFARDLQEELGAEFEVQPEWAVFHWESDNKPDDRVAATINLREHLVKLGLAGKDVHVIAHSHGG